MCLGDHARLRPAPRPLLVACVPPGHVTHAAATAGPHCSDWLAWLSPLTSHRQPHSSIAVHRTTAVRLARPQRCTALQLPPDAWLSLPQLPQLLQPRLLLPLLVPLLLLRPIVLGLVVSTSPLRPQSPPRFPARFWSAPIDFLSREILRYPLSFLTFVPHHYPPCIDVHLLHGHTYQDWSTGGKHGSGVVVSHLTSNLFVSPFFLISSLGYLLHSSLPELTIRAAARSTDKVLLTSVSALVCVAHLILIHGTLILYC